MVVLLKSAPRQIIAAYKKGYNNAPGVPLPESLRERQDPRAGPPPPGKDSQTK